MPSLFFICTGKQLIQKKIVAPNSGLVFIKIQESYRPPNTVELVSFQKQFPAENWDSPLQQKKKKKYMLMQRHCRNNSQERFYVCFHLQKKYGPNWDNVLLRILPHRDCSSTIQMNPTEKITCLIIYTKGTLSTSTFCINLISKALDMISDFALPHLISLCSS